MVLVEELGAACAVPAASVNENERDTVRPWRVASGQFNRPVADESVQFSRKSPSPNGARSQPRPMPLPPKNSGRSPPPIMLPLSCALQLGIRGPPASPLAEKLLSV